MVSRGVLVPSDEGCQLQPGANARIPDALHEVWLARVEDLLHGAPPSTGVALELAAVLGTTVEPGEWAAVCVPSPSGYLYTQVTDWTSTTLDGGDGDLFKVTEIGVMAPDPDDTVGSVHDWLSDEARDRDIFPNPVTRFERLVFEDGVVTGAVFGTESGPLTVRARHGVLICRNGIPARGASPPGFPGHAPLRVALVGKEASRFGRVELLTSDSAVAQACPLHSSRPAAPEVRTSRS